MRDLQDYEYFESPTQMMNPTTQYIFLAVKLYNHSKIIQLQGQLPLQQKVTIKKMLQAKQETFIILMQKQDNYVLCHYSKKGTLYKQLQFCMRKYQNIQIQLGQQDICLVLLENIEKQCLDILQWNIQNYKQLWIRIQDFVGPASLAYFYFTHIFCIGFVNKSSITYKDYTISLQYYKFPIQNSSDKPISSIKINQLKQQPFEKPSAHLLKIKKLNNFAMLGIYSTQFTKQKLTKILTIKLNEQTKECLIYMQQLAFINKFNPNHKVFGVRIVDIFQISFQAFFISFQSKFDFQIFFANRTPNQNDKKQIKSFDKLIKFHSFIWMYKLDLCKPISLNSHQKFYVQILDQNCMNNPYQNLPQSLVTAYNQYQKTSTLIVNRLNLTKCPVYYIDISVQEQLQVYAKQPGSEFIAKNGQIPHMSVSGYAPQKQLFYFNDVVKKDIKYMIRQISNIDRYRVLFAFWMTQLMNPCDQEFIQQVLLMLTEPTQW